MFNDLLHEYVVDLLHLTTLIVAEMVYELQENSPRYRQGRTTIWYGMPYCKMWNTYP